MIELTLLDGSPTSVNPMQVFSFAMSHEGTVIWPANGPSVVVKESYSTVKTRFAGWAKG